MSESEKVAWNLSGGLIDHMVYLVTTASRFYINRDTEEAYRTLKVIRLLVIPSLKKEEREKLKSLELKVQSIITKLNTTTPRGFEKPKKEHLESRSHLLIAYEEYFEELMDKLNKYGYLIQKKDDMTKLGI